MKKSNCDSEIYELALSVINYFLFFLFLIKSYMRDQHEGKLSMWEMVLQQSMLCVAAACHLNVLQVWREFC